MNSQENYVHPTSLHPLKDKLFSFFKNFLIPVFFAAVILFTSGYAKTTTRQGSFNSSTLIILLGLTICLLIALVLLIPVKKYKEYLHPLRNKIYKQQYLYYVGFGVLLLIGLFVYYYIKGNDLFTLAHYVLLIAFGFAFALVIPFKTFTKYYNKTVAYLGLFSFILFLILLAAGDLPFFTSTFTSGNDARYRSFLGLFYRIDVGNPRNYGPFWEPGIFSLVLLIALIFEIMQNKRPNLLYIGIYVATIFTTFSTSAILLLPFCVPLFFALHNNKKWFYITLPIATVLVAGVIVLGNPSFKIPFFSVVFSKLFANDSGSGSFTTRLLSPLYGVRLFANSYGLGFGPNIFDAKYEVLTLFGKTNPIEQTSTVGWLFGSFGVFGILFISVAFAFLIFYFWKKFNLKSAIFAAIFALVIINCEPMYSFSIFWIIFSYPISLELKEVVLANGDKTTLIESVTKSKSTSSLTFSNMFWSVLIKVVALLIGLLMYPMYLKYFGNQTSMVSISGSLTTQGAVALGAWLVIIQILSWVLMFDIGIGNGLKTKLVESLSKNDVKESKKLISSSYISNALIIAAVLVVGLPIIFLINFNPLLNISSEVIPVNTLRFAFALAFISICIEFVLKIVLNIYQAMQKQVIASLIPLISTILLLIFVAFVRIEDMSKSLIVISLFYILSVNLPLIVLTLILFGKKLKECRPSVKEWSMQTAKSIVALGGIYFLIQIFLLVINSTNKVIISNVYGAEAVTFYEPYLKIFSAICAVGSALSLPIWTLTIRADVKKEYGWFKKAEKIIVVLIVVFIFGSLLAAAILQILFDLWLKSNTFTVSMTNAFLFAVWAIATICSYFTSGISNGLRILKPQVIVFGIAAVLKIPVFIILHRVIPSLDWSLLLIIDSVVMGVASAVMAILNHRAIKQRLNQNIVEE